MGWICTNFNSSCVLLRIAMKERSVAATNLNEFSSRSHFILQLRVQTTIKSDGTRYQSKINLIDLVISSLLDSEWVLTTSRLVLKTTRGLGIQGRE